MIKPRYRHHCKNCISLGSVDMIGPPPGEYQDVYWCANHTYHGDSYADSSGSLVRRWESRVDSHNMLTSRWWYWVATQTKDELFSKLYRTALQLAVSRQLVCKSDAIRKTFERLGLDTEE